MSNKDKDYAKYLQTRRWSSFVYRYLFVYPFFLRYPGKNNYDYDYDYDNGCGVGDFLKFAKIFKKKIIGLDVNRENLKICQNRRYSVDLLIPKRKNLNFLRVWYFIFQFHHTRRKLCHALLMIPFLMIVSVQKNDI